MVKSGKRGLSPFSATDLVPYAAGQGMCHALFYTAPGPKSKAPRPGCDRGALLFVAYGTTRRLPAGVLGLGRVRFVGKDIFNTFGLLLPLTFHGQRGANHPQFNQSFFDKSVIFSHLLNIHGLIILQQRGKVFPELGILIPEKRIQHLALHDDTTLQ